VYYAESTEILHKELPQEISRGSAFVTDRALFGIKLIGGNAKHVVALDAHTMKNGAGNRRHFWQALGRWRAGSGGSRLSHGRIVARRNRPAKCPASPRGAGASLFCGLRCRVFT